MNRLPVAVPLLLASVCLLRPGMAENGSPSNPHADGSRIASAVSTDNVLPTADFDANFCNFPQAWSLTNGENVRVGVVFEPTDKSPDWVQRIASLAPASAVVRIPQEDFMAGPGDGIGFQVLLLLSSVEEPDYSKALQVIEAYIRNGTAVILPAYFGSMRENFDYSHWRRFIKRASELDAIVVGAHGRTYQLGRASFWQDMPVDTYALNFGIDGDKYLARDVLVPRDLEASAYLAAGAAALMRSLHPHLSPAALKRMFQRHGRKVLWFDLELEPEPGTSMKLLYPVLNLSSVGTLLKRFEMWNARIKEASIGRVQATIQGSTLDAGLLLGMEPMGNGEWCYRSLRLASAKRMATGQGVTVAILDHMFDANDQALAGRVVKPASVVDGAPVFSLSGHGTWMARALTEVAPDVTIMPVRVVPDDGPADAGSYIKGIEYAVENGADIISLSHPAVATENRDALDQAVARASERNVSFVYIHYESHLEEVIEAGPIEMARFEPGRKVIHVVGTNFIREDTFPNTWGLSQTAPIVAGVLAMMKELKPELTPLEAKQILFKASEPVGSRYSILNAAAAIAAVDRSVH